MEKLQYLSEDEFDHIEETISRTQKGRAFLRRYHRRAMGAATAEFRAMLDEFRRMWRDQPPTSPSVGHIEVLRRELIEMAASIDQARKEVAAIQPPDGANNKILSATNELDAIVISTERASFEILNAAERLIEISTRLRQEGVDAELCADIDNQVTSIFTACSFQDLTGQRTSKVVNALRYIEQRINAMISIWGLETIQNLGAAGGPPVGLSSGVINDTREDAHLLHGPALEGQGISQNDIDSLMGGGGSMSPSVPAYAPPPPAPASASAQSGQSDIDRMFDAPAPPPKAAAPVRTAAPVQSGQSDIDRMFDAPAPPPKAAAPAPASSGPQSQDDIDRMFDIVTMPAAPAPAPAPAPPPPPAAKPAAPKPAPAKAAAPKAAPPPVAEAPKPKPKPPAAVAKPPPPPPPPPPPAKEPATGGGGGFNPLDQAAIDALFG